MLLRYLWTEATIHAVRKDPELKRFYRRKLIQKGMEGADCSGATTRGIRLWMMLRDQIDDKVLPPRTAAAVRGKPMRNAIYNSGPALELPGNEIGYSPPRMGGVRRVIMIDADRRDVWWATPPLMK